MLCRRFTAVALAIAAFGVAAPAWAQNTCPGPVMGYAPVTGNTAGAPVSGAASCGSSNATAANYWNFIAPCTGTYRFTTCGSTYDTVLSVHSGCPAATANQLACNDDDAFCGGNPARQSRVELALTAGTSYVIRVSGFAGSTGDYTLSITPLDLAAPGNDSCANAIDMNSYTNYTGNTACSTRDGDADCNTNFSGDVWYAYTPGCSGSHTFSTCGSAFDTLISVHTGCPGDLSNDIGCNDDSCGLQSNLTVNLNAGTRYLVRLTGYFNRSGDYTIRVVPGPDVVAPNDSCAGAIPMAGGVTYFGDTRCASPDGEANCGGAGNAAPDLWYSFFAPCTGSYLFATCGSGYDTVISLHSGCPGNNSNILACNDDSCGLQSRISANLTAGTTYLVRVAGFVGRTGPFNISVTGTPTNDSCENAISVGDGVTQYSNACATTDGPPACGNFGSDVWFVYTAPSTCFTTVTTCSANRTYDTVLAVYDAPCRTGALLGCNDDGPPSCGNPGVPFSGSTVNFNAIAGNQYLIRVGGFNGARGSSDLTITQSAPNDNCANATPIGLGVFPYSTSCATTDGPAAACGGLANDIWYSYTAPNAAQITVTTCSPNRNYDTVIAVYDGPCTGAQVGCNDDGPPFCGNAGVPFSGSTIVFNPTAGSQYLIRVGGFTGARGQSDLTLSRACTGGCVADFDDGSSTNSPDGGVTIDDLLYYLGIFGDGVLCADIDDGSGTGTHDGGVTIDDLLYFIARFTAGC